MPTGSTLLLFLGAAVILAAMPGPGLLYIAGRTLAAGRGDGLSSCVGAMLGGLVHVIAGAVGVSALIMASATAFTLLKLLGGAYLLYLGVQAWRGADAPISAGAMDVDGGRALRQAFVVEATNPKTAAFFLALIPQFVDAESGSVALQFGLFGVISVLLNTVMAVLTVWAAFGVRRCLFSRKALVRRVRRASGVMLGGLGVSLLLTRRPA